MRHVLHQLIEILMFKLSADMLKFQPPGGFMLILPQEIAATLMQRWLKTQPGRLHFDLHGPAVDRLGSTKPCCSSWSAWIQFLAGADDSTWTHPENMPFQKESHVPNIQVWWNAMKFPGDLFGGFLHLWHFGWVHAWNFSDPTFSRCLVQHPTFQPFWADALNSSIHPLIGWREILVETSLSFDKQLLGWVSFKNREGYLSSMVFLWCPWRSWQISLFETSLGSVRQCIVIIVDATPVEMDGDMLQS